jgi:ATP-dependent RNA helicase RhlE
LAEYLTKQGITAERLHGNRSQPQRIKALAGFKSGAYKVLVATDIAARGIDIHQLGHVINFDVPALADDYIHRVGRTARAEATGDAYTFVSPEEEEDMRTIERMVGKRLPRITLPDFDYTPRSNEQPAMPLAGRSQTRGNGRGARSAPAATHAKPDRGAKARGSSARGRETPRPAGDSGPYATDSKDASTPGGRHGRRGRRR